VSDHSGLVVSGAVQRFGSLTALDGVDLAVRPGERHGLIGPNGSGKSTILRVLAGSLRPAKGTVELDGVDVTRWSASRRTRAGITLKFQMPRVFSELTVRENLALAARFRTRDDAVSEGSREVLALLESTDVANAPVGQLSHGYRQWLELAMALETRPDFLLLDEPTAGMSPGERARTGELIRGTSCAIVIVDHDIPFVAELCDRMTLLHDGVVRASGPTREVLEDALLRELYTEGARDADRA
jgi:branched-chain amino acid transport system ATP-binding protein